MIPTSFALAQPAGPPACLGLYAALVPGAVAALWGRSNQLGSGPLAGLSELTALITKAFAVKIPKRRDPIQKFVDPTTTNLDSGSRKFATASVCSFTALAFAFAVRHLGKRAARGSFFAEANHLQSLGCQTES